ncbi:MAG: pyrroline-5-carboxylate reductase [Clostridia bacterium]|nr:pyrroline-5-carboxylate reductase [Clostridia bacterium]
MKTGFIGAGNMGSSIVSGMIKSGNFKKEDIFVCDKIISDDIKSLGVSAVSIDYIVKNCQSIVLAVKPNTMEAVLEEIKKTEGYEKKLFISIAAGFKLERIEKVLGSIRAVRVMPNICLKALEGMTVVASNKNCTEDDTAAAEKIFSSCGKTARVKEDLIDSCTAINGSGPAYVFMFMEALSDAAVKNGIDRETAYLLSAQTVLGSAKLMMDSAIHPGKLKDMVCSPGGTTIEAVAQLENKGFRDAVISAVDACTEKAKKMAREK